MEENTMLTVGAVDEQYVAVDTHGTVIPLVPGTTCELWTGDQWQAINLHSGGYRGRYYETIGGVRGRLALCQSIRQVNVPLLAAAC